MHRHSLFSLTEKVARSSARLLLEVMNLLKLAFSGKAAFLNAVNDVNAASDDFSRRVAHQSE